MRGALIKDSESAVPFERLRDEVAERYLDATDTVQVIGVYDASGTAVSGIGLPIAASYRTGSDGNFIAVIPATAALTVGQRYRIVGRATSASRQRTFTLEDVPCLESAH